MTDEKSEDWRTICAMVLKEKDPARLLLLVKELNNALDEAFGPSTSGKITEKQDASKN